MTPPRTNPPCPSSAPPSLSSPPSSPPSSGAPGVAAVVVASLVASCAHAPPREATASGCARARLAREWHDASSRPLEGCWRAAELPGVVMLTSRPVVDDDASADPFADRPPTFVLDGDPIVAQPTLRAWELLGHGLARLTWSTGFSGVTACVAPDGDDRLRGELRVFTDSSPLPSAPRPVVFVRVPCPR
jgi:hypothetical protein